MWARRRKQGWAIGATWRPTSAPYTAQAGTRSCSAQRNLKLAIIADARHAPVAKSPLLVIQKMDWLRMAQAGVSLGRDAWSRVPQLG